MLKESCCKFLCFCHSGSCSQLQIDLVLNHVGKGFNVMVYFLNLTHLMCRLINTVVKHCYFPVDKKV